MARRGLWLSGLIVLLGLAGCSGSSHARLDGGDPPSGDPDGGADADAGVDAGMDAGLIAQGYSVSYLVSNGSPDASVTDTTLVDPWGLSSGTIGPVWVASEGNGTVRAYSLDAGPGDIFEIPADGGVTEPPMGVVWNGEESFDADDAIVGTDSGQIVGWSQGMPAVVRVDNSATLAVYKSLALARTADGDRLYAANFRSALVEMYNGDYSLLSTFTDPGIPAGFSPFNIAVINQLLYVTFAKQDDNDKDEVTGAGYGYVDVFDLTGDLQTELLAGGALNAPYGIVYSPIDFGRFANLLLIANVGDGSINVFDPVYGTYLGPLVDADYVPINIPTIHGLLFGNGDGAGTPDTLFFTAGPDSGADGAFGAIVPVY